MTTSLFGVYVKYIVPAADCNGVALQGTECTVCSVIGLGRLRVRSKQRDVMPVCCIVHKFNQKNDYNFTDLLMAYYDYDEHVRAARKCSRVSV